MSAHTHGTLTHTCAQAGSSYTSPTPNAHTPSLHTLLHQAPKVHTWDVCICTLTHLHASTRGPLSPCTPAHSHGLQTHTCAGALMHSRACIIAHGRAHTQGSNAKLCTPMTLSSHNCKLCTHTPRTCAQGARMHTATALRAVAPPPRLCRAATRPLTAQAAAGSTKFPGRLALATPLPSKPRPLHAPGGAGLLSAVRLRSFVLLTLLRLRKLARTGDRSGVFGVRSPRALGCKGVAAGLALCPLLRAGLAVLHKHGWKKLPSRVFPIPQPWGMPPPPCLYPGSRA